MAEDFGLDMYGAPSTKRDQDGVVETIMRSLSNPTGCWHRHIPNTKEDIRDILTYEPESFDADRLRSLGLDDENLSDREFAEKLVQWEGFFHQHPVKFVRYDEEMYNFVKEGETTRDKDGKLVSKSSKQCARASDWYNELDQRS